MLDSAAAPGSAAHRLLPAQDTTERESWYINMGAVDKSLFTVRAMTEAAP
jgi:hypothetical protein